MNFALATKRRAIVESGRSARCETQSEVKQLTVSVHNSCAHLYARASAVAVAYCASRSAPVPIFAPASPEALVALSAPRYAPQFESCTRNRTPALPVPPAPPIRQQQPAATARPTSCSARQARTRSKNGRAPRQRMAACSTAAGSASRSAARPRRLSLFLAERQRPHCKRLRSAPAAAVAAASNAARVLTTCSRCPRLSSRRARRGRRSTHARRGRSPQRERRGRGRRSRTRAASTARSWTQSACTRERKRTASAPAVSAPCGSHRQSALADERERAQRQNTKAAI